MWFSVEDVAATLNEACIDQSDSNVQFSTDVNDPSTYLLTAPAVKKPFALLYKIIADDIDGEIDNHTFNMCIQPINDAPQTTDDTYIVEYLNDLTIPYVGFDNECKVATGQGVLDNDHDYQSYAASTGNCISGRLTTAPIAHNGVI